MRFFLNVVAAFLGVVAATVFLFILLVAIFASQDSTPSVANRTVLVVDLNRALPETQPQDPFAEVFGGTTITLRETIDALERAAVDDRITGVWLRPAGVQASWATLAELRDALERFRASGKPLLASSGTHGFTEPGYFLATAADSVFTPPEATFQLNGFHLSAMFFGGTFERLGIEPVVVRAGDFKGAAETFTERGFSPENREQYEEILHAADRRFRQTVAAGRNMNPAVIDQTIAAGGIYRAADALHAGFVDDLRYEHEVEAAWRARTEQDADAELRTIDLAQYRRVPDRDAGVELGNRANRVAVVYASGMIMPGSGESGDFLASEAFVETMQEALRDSRTRAIVVRIDSPGGAATASDAMWAAVRDAADRVPVVVSMASVAASGGYYMAAPAHAIVAEPGTITGSIGVISMLFDATNFLDDRLGITIDTLSTGPAAGMYSPFESVSPLELEILERQTEAIYDTFVNRVAAGRGLSPDSVRALGAGRVYTGERAMQVGLVDELGDLRHAIALAAERAELGEGDYRLLILPRRRPLIERLSEAFSTQAMVAWWVNRNMTREERLLRQEAATLRQAAAMHGTPQMLLPSVPEIR
jgi:protease IV